MVLGAILGGFLSANYLSDHTVNINPEVVTKLESYGSNSAGEAYSPTDIFRTESLSDPKILAVLLLGGFWLVLVLVSWEMYLCAWYFRFKQFVTSFIIVVIEFFIRGLIMVNFIYPLIF